MGNELFGKRKQALEESFFAKRDAEIIAKLRAKNEREEQKAALAKLAGTADDSLLNQLMDLGVTTETMAALALAPLVVVAWADGTVDDKETEAVLSAAGDAGIEAGEPAHQLLHGWLANEPGAELLTSWKAMAQTLGESLDESGKATLKGDLLGRARKVAEAAGGFLGFNTISETEAAVLADLEQTIS